LLQGSLYGLEHGKKRTSGAKALNGSGFYGTAKPVPFVEVGLPTAKQAAEKLLFPLQLLRGLDWRFQGESVRGLSKAQLRNVP
jgi:hypothetical protein